MVESASPQFLAEVKTLLKTIVDSVRCSNCSNVIREPQKGSCRHDACAKCWGASGKICTTCKNNSGVTVVPNVELARRVDTVLNLVKSFKDWSKIDVLSHDSNETEVSISKDAVLNECFYETDKKYNNLKTYQGKTKPIGRKKKSTSECDTDSDCNEEVISSKKTVEKKVDTWLTSPDNVFVPSKKRLSKKEKKETVTHTKNVPTTSSVSDLPKLEEKNPNKSNDSASSRLEKEAKQWMDVKKCSKTFRRGKKPLKKKLSVSVETCTKSNSDLIKSDKLQIKDNEDIYTLSSESPLFSKDKTIQELKNTEISQYHPQIEGISRIEMSPKNKNINTCHDIFTSNSLKSTNSETHKNVPFIYHESLLKRIQSRLFKKKTPFHNQLISKSSVVCDAEDENLHIIKIKRGDSITSILIKNENLKHSTTVTKSTSAQTDISLFGSGQHSFIAENNKFVKTKTNSIYTNKHSDIDLEKSDKSKSHNKSTNMSYSKRRISENSDNLDLSNPVKKSKLSISEMPLDDNMVVCFDSQSQLFEMSNKVSEISSEKVVPVPLRLPEGITILEYPETVAQTIEDPKLLAMKRSIAIYKGNSPSPPPKSFNKSITVNQKNIKEKNSNTLQVCSDTEVQILDDLNTPECSSKNSNDIIIEDTPQKSKIKKIVMKSLNRTSSTKENVNTLNTNTSKSIPKSGSNVSKDTSTSDMDETLICNPLEPVYENKLIDQPVLNKIITPSSVNKFIHEVRYQSTPLQPLSRKSLTYNYAEKCSITQDDEQSVKPLTSKSRSFHSQSLLEKEFQDEAMETPNKGKAIESNEKKNLRRSPRIDKNSTLNIEPVDTENINDSSFKKKRKGIQRVCFTCSLLDVSEKTFISSIAAEMGWDYSSTFHKDLTHLVVKVDHNNRTQRTEKYIRALAAGCWIVSFNWVKECHKAKSLIPEEPFEALDMGGDRGPHIMRTLKTKLFQDITFYILPPIELLKIPVLMEVLLATGGKIAKTLEEVIVKDPNKVSVVIAEVNDTQEDRFIDMCSRYPLVPVNIEWILESLGRGKRNSLDNWILCPIGLDITSWPSDLFLSNDNSLN